MAKLGLSIGIDADVTGLRKMGQQVTGELEKLRGATNRIGSSVSAAMAMPMVGFLSNVMQANAEARKIRDELMFPFSHKMHEAQISADMRKMQVGQRMVAAGMDESAARSMTLKAEEEMMTGLMAQGPRGMIGRSLESFLTEPTKFMANMVRAGEGGLQVRGAQLSELFSGNVMGAMGFGPMSEANQAAVNLGQARSQAATAIATQDIGQFEGTRMQLERQTYALLEIERNTKGSR
jgi:hypothetical protein